MLLLAAFLNPKFAFAAGLAAGTDNSITADSSGQGGQVFTAALAPSATSSIALDFFDGDLSLTFAAGGLSAPAELEVKRVVAPSGTLPWQLDLSSEIYEYRLDAASIVSGRPILVKLRPRAGSNFLRQIFYYNETAGSWLPLPSKVLPQSKRIQAETRDAAARLAVFSYPAVLTTGRASWYSYKKGLFTASPDFPKGSKLRVFNVENNKFVDVEVNDFGPERDRHPDRVVDLEKTAFKKIAKTGQGTIRVRIEPLYIPSTDGRILGIAKAGARTEPGVTAKSAVVINSKSGEVLWGKNQDARLPIASLTKLVTAKVFLDTRPSLDRVVAYSKQDDEYNRLYAAAGTIARLKVRDGETLTIGDLLHSALIGSANNAIEGLVRVSGLEREEFISRMNEQATAWGASSTRFVEPTGLSPENVSTALDYAIMTNRVLDHPIIEKISKMKSYEFYTRNTKKRHLIRNTNPLITLNRLKVTGSKTGYLEEANYCLMTRAKDEKGREVIAVTLGTAEKSRSFSETEDLINYSLRLLN